MIIDEILQGSNKIFASWTIKVNHGEIITCIIDTNGDCWESYDEEHYVKIGTFIGGIPPLCQKEKI